MDDKITGDSPSEAVGRPSSGIRLFIGGVIGTNILACAVVALSLE